MFIKGLQKLINQQFIDIRYLAYIINFTAKAIRQAFITDYFKIKPELFRR
jgi:hypothetical protein